MPGVVKMDIEGRELPLFEELITTKATFPE